MEKQVQKISNNTDGNCRLTVLLILTLMLAGMTGMAQRAYILNNNDGNISVINVPTNTVIKTIPVSYYPLGVSASADGSRVYVTNDGDASVSVINTTTNTVVKTIPVDFGPTGICVTPDGSKVYLGSGDSSLTVISSATDTVIAAIPVGKGPQGVVVSPDGKRVYVTGYDAGIHSYIISVINTSADTVLAKIPIHASDPENVCISPDGSKLYVLDYIYTSMFVINTVTNTVADSIPVAKYSYGMSISPDGSKLYVTTTRDTCLRIISTATKAVLSTIKVGKWPTGVSVSPDGKKVFVINGDGNSVSVVSTATNTVTATIPVGSSPEGRGNFISTYAYVPACGAGFSIAADTAQLHHYIVTENSFGTPPLKHTWSWGDGTEDTASWPSHIYADSGFYNICLSITDSTGCQNTFCDYSFHALRTNNTMVYVSVFNPLTTGIQAIDAPVLQVTLYPNPFTSQTTIAFGEEQRNTTITVRDLPGNEIKTITHVRGRQVVLDKGELSSGIYFVQIMDEKRRVVNKKIIVQ